MHTESPEPASEPSSGGFPGSARVSRLANRKRGISGERDCRGKYQPGAVLYREGHDCAGIFHIETGEVRLSISSSSGRTAILKIARPGELLALTEAFVNCPYLATAEVIKQSQVFFTPRTHLQGIWSNHSWAVQIVGQLTRECARMFKEVSAYRLSSMASQRLAHLLLELLEHETELKRKEVVEMPYTHAEIGQMIGCSRETVTRLLKRFQERKVFHIDGSNLYIDQMEKLREISQL